MARRLGKDFTVWNLMIAAALQEKGLYIYALPQLNQAKLVIWKAIANDGLKFLDCIPKGVISKINNSEMSIEFINGSIIKLAGCDRYDSLMGCNAKGIALSEHSLQNPLAWQYLRPIITVNGGWAVLFGTPRGKNHAYETWEMARKSPDWYTIKVTAEDAFDHQGNRIVTKEMIQQELDSGMPEELVNQEYLCSWESHSMGAIYGKLMQDMEEQGRIGQFKPPPGTKLFTAIDLGYRDATAIWFFYVNIKGEYIYVHYYENNFEPMEHYINYITNWGPANKYPFLQHFAPHDALKTEYASGKSIAESARQMGIHFRVCQRTGIQEGIFAVRRLMPKMYFDLEGCKRGIQLLKDYSYDYDAVRKIFSDKPRHDYASHGCDALRYSIMGYSEHWSKPPALSPIRYTNLTGH